MNTCKAIYFIEVTGKAWQLISPLTVLFLEFAN